MFKELKTAVANRFDQMRRLGTLFTVAYDRDTIWEAYLNAFPEDGRQEHNCNSCKAFIRSLLERKRVADLESLPTADIEAQLAALEAE